MNNFKDLCLEHEHWICTLMFDREVPTEPADRLFRIWKGRIREALERDNLGPEVHILWALLAQLSEQGRRHFHVLLCARGLGDLSIKNWEIEWENMGSYCGAARITLGYQENIECVLKYFAGAKIE